jgi:predicted  nucleic acid-binding Zn-ribbon protein
MALGDLFKAKENEKLKARIAELECILTPEMWNSLLLQEKISNQQQILKELETDCAQVKKELFEINNKIKQASVDLVQTEETVLLQSFGLYKPRFQFANATRYKEELSKIRAKQKESIKNGTAATGYNGWTVNGDANKGAKMIHDMQKLLIRAFNTECDDVIDHVKFNNVEAAEKRIQTAFSTISKLGSVCGVAISESYRSLKIKELYLAHEYQIEKQKEKERLKELRAEERERAKLEKEIEAERKKLEKEKKHYANALKQVLQQISVADPSALPDLEKKKAELEAKAADVSAAITQVDYRAANQKAGYVYIISNLGAFGEGVYKIVMTRRLEPMDRIDELGDASVPFDFDVHALIFSDNAPALEAALHHAFEDRKLNMVNTRREFFRVSLDEIKEVVKKNYDKTVEFIDIPMAEQFRQSELMRNQ